MFDVVIVTAPPRYHEQHTDGPLVKFDNRESVLRCAEMFVNRDGIGQIQVVFSDDKYEQAKQKLGSHLTFAGVKLTRGGSTWPEQFATAAETLSDDAKHVVVHDAARPAVPYSDLDAIFQHAEKHDAVALAATIDATLLEVDRDQPLGYRDPSAFRRLLTPQAFSVDTFRRIASSNEEPDAAAFHLIEGSPLNIRLRSSADAKLAKAMLNLLPKPKVKGPSNPFEEAQW